MIHLHIKKSVLSVSFTLMMYYMLMELYYLFFIGVEYTVYGFKIDVNLYKYIETKIYFFLTLFLTTRAARVSPFMYCINVFFIVFFLVPNLITFSLGNQPAGPVYSTVSLLLGLILISFFKIRIPNVEFKSISSRLTLLLVVLSLIPIFAQFGMYVNIQNLLLKDVYSTRDLFYQNNSAAINYLYPWMVKALLPLLLIYFLVRRQYVSALCSFLILFYLYAISGNKLVYITIFVMLFFYLFGRDYYEKIKYFCLALVFGLISLPLVDSLFFQGDSTLKGTFVMRMLFLPSQVNYYYFDFFRNKPLYFAESHFFSWFVTYPYERPIGYIISEKYFNAPDMNSNNGIIGDGYMNLGYAGVALNIFLVMGIFLFFKSLNIDSRYLGIFFVMTFLLLSVPMLSMFITSGLWIISIMSMTAMKTRMEPLKS